MGKISVERKSFQTCQRIQEGFNSNRRNQEFVRQETIISQHRNVWKPNRNSAAAVPTGSSNFKVGNHSGKDIVKGKDDMIEILSQDANGHNLNAPNEVQVNQETDEGTHQVSSKVA